MTTDDLLKLCAELDEKVKAASPLPWDEDNAEEAWLKNRDNNANYCRAAANAIPTLVAQVRSLVGINASLVSEQERQAAEIRRLVEENGRLKEAFDRLNVDTARDVFERIAERDRLTADLAREREQRGELVDRLNILRRYHGGDGSITRERASQALERLKGERGDK